MNIPDIVTAALILGGSTLALTAAIGVVRFPDTLSRMHAATKPQVLGLLLVLVGAAIRLRGNADVGMLILTGIFTVITAPVVANRVGQLAYREQNIHDKLDQGRTTRVHRRRHAMARTDDDSWDITESVGATALGWRGRDPGGDVGVPAVHRPVCGGVHRGGHRARLATAAASHGRADPLDIGIRRIAHQMVRRVLHRRGCGRHRPGGDPRRGAGRQGVAAAMERRQRGLRDRPTQGAGVQDRDAARARRDPATRYVPVPVDLRQDWPKALREAGFDVTEPTAWAAEGLLPYLPAEGQDLLFERIADLSAQGSRVGVEAFGAGFFDPEYLASRRERMRQMREEAGVDDDTPDVQDLWYIEDRAEVTDWFSARGWEVSAIEAVDLMKRYGRTTDDDTTPRTVFVEAQAPPDRLVARQLELDHRADGFDGVAQRRQPRRARSVRPAPQYRSACPIGKRVVNAYNHIAASGAASAPATMSRALTSAPRAPAIRSNSAIMRSSTSGMASAPTGSPGSSGHSSTPPAGTGCRDAILAPGTARPSRS